MALIISAGVGCGEDHLAQNIETSVEDTTVSISWDPPYERVQLVHFDVECSTLNQTTRTSVGNQTHTAQLIGLSSYTAYNCCVLAVFQSYTSKVCAHNNIYTRLYSGSTYQTNGSCVICVVYGIIINTILSILLALAIVASIYPCLIRPRIRKSKSKILSRWTTCIIIVILYVMHVPDYPHSAWLFKLSVYVNPILWHRISEFVDRKFYTHIYGTKDEAQKKVLKHFE